MSDHPHSVFQTTTKFKWNFLYFNFFPLPLVLSLGSTEKSLAPSSLVFLSGICIYGWDLHTHALKSPSNLKAKQSQLSWLLFLQQRFQWCLLQPLFCVLWVETLIVGLQSVWSNFRERILQKVHSKVSASDNKNQHFRKVMMKSSEGWCNKA